MRRAATVAYASTVSRQLSPAMRLVLAWSLLAVGPPGVAAEAAAMERSAEKIALMFRLCVVGMIFWECLFNLSLVVLATLR